MLGIVLRHGLFLLTAQYERLDRDLWISVLKMEGKFLSGGFGNREDAFVLRRTIQYHRDQLHLSSHSCAVDDRKLEKTDAGKILLRFKSAAENHALGKVARLRRHTRLFLQGGERSW